jgi:hypothetical protein
MAGHPVAAAGQATSSAAFHSMIEPYWFLEAMLQCLLIISVLCLLPGVRRCDQQRSVAPRHRLPRPPPWS